jgi:hypothetical protein
MHLCPACRESGAADPYLPQRVVGIARMRATVAVMRRRGNREAPHSGRSIDANMLRPPGPSPTQRSRVVCLNLRKSVNAYTRTPIVLYQCR